MKWPPWTMKSALKLIRNLESNLDHIGWHCGMLGSVLIHGRSDKDLDIVIYPHKSRKDLPISLDYVYDVLKSVGLTRLADCSRVREIWIKTMPEAKSDDKHVEIWMFDHKRIDIFVMR